MFEANCSKVPSPRRPRPGRRARTLRGVGGADARADILIDILDYNRSVEGNYRQYTVETKKGILLTGLLAGETRTYVEVLDSEGRKHVVQRDEIENLTASKLSLMPEGFERIGSDGLASLLEFLTARDHFFPLPLAKAATIDSVRGMFNSRTRIQVRTSGIPVRRGPNTANGIPFQVLDPRGGSVPNVIVLNGPQGAVSRRMPKSVTVPCNAAAKAIHLLGGVGGWGFPAGRQRGRPR